MINKNALLTYVTQLLELARARNTAQGINVYEGAIKKIEEASSQEDIEKIFDKIKQALAGIEAHGHFTNEEFEMVKEIRAMNQ